MTRDGAWRHATRDCPLALPAARRCSRTAPVSSSLPRGVQRIDFGGPIIACVGDHEFGIGGVVCIASPAYRDAITHQDTGLIATTSDHWGQYLTNLLTEERVRKRLQVGAVAEARLHTTIQGSDSWLHTVGTCLP